MNEVYLLLIFGLIAGTLSGLIGIGGGIILVPALIYFLGFSQHSAQGTVLFMFLLPIGVLGTYNFWQKGYVDWRTASIMAITYFIGSFIGSKIAISMDQNQLKKIFGILLFLVSLKMFFGK